MERREIDEAPEEEAAELALIFKQKGLSTEQASRTAAEILKNPESAADTLVREELGLDPTDLGSPGWAGSSGSSPARASGSPRRAWRVLPRSPRASPTASAGSSGRASERHSCAEVALVGTGHRRPLLGVRRRREAAHPLPLLPPDLPARSVVARHRRQAEPVHRDGVGSDRVQPVDVDEPLGEEDRRRADPLLDEVAHELRVVDAHLSGEERPHEVHVALLERRAQEVEGPAVAALVGRVLREGRAALEHPAAEHPLAHERRLHRREPREQVAVHLEEVGAARGHVDRDRPLAELDVPLVGDVAGEELRDDAAALLRLGRAREPDAEDGEHRLAVPVHRGEDVPEPFVVGERADLPLAEAGALAQGDARRAGRGVGGEPRADDDLHVAAEERVADLRDPRRRLVRVEREVLVTRPRAGRPGPRDGEVVDVVIGEAVARVAVEAARDLVEAPRPARGEQVRDEHELVAAAPQELLDGVPTADLLADLAEFPLPLLRREAERGVLGARQLLRTRLEEALVDVRVPVDGAQHAERLLRLDDLIAELAEVLLRHAGTVARSARRPARTAPGRRAADSRRDLPAPARRRAGTAVAPGGRRRQP